MMRHPLLPLLALGLLQYPHTTLSAPIKPGVWLWNCDGAAYTGAHPHGYYTHQCLRNIYQTRPSQLQGALHVFPWAQVEPEDGKFDWSGVDANLTSLAANGVQVSPTIWIHKGASISGMVPTPDWLFKVSPGVAYQHVRGKGPKLYAPNYLDPIFQQRFQRLITNFANHLNTLPKNVKQNIWAVEASLGITGDSRPWKGVPVNPKQDISQTQWIQYNHKFLQIYVDAFVSTGIPVIANVENPGYGQVGLEQPGWFLKMAESRGMKGAALKQGTVSHGYNLNGEVLVYKYQALPLLLAPRKDGSYARSRGELALEPDAGLPGSYGNWAYSPHWSLQANAEWALTYGLDAWNLYAGWVNNESFAETLEFFNRHAGHKDIKTSPAAFISFRDSLNTENTRRWPESKYGPVDDKKNPDRMANVNRMSKIAKDFKSFGARLDDPTEAADKRPVIQKKGNHLSDVCWSCWPTNYYRFIQQVRPYESSVGWWQQGPRDQPYGRFARGLQHSTNRAKITLKLDQGFSLSNATARIVYLDQKGDWAISLNNKPMSTVAMKGTGRWVSAEVGLGRVRGEDQLFLTSPSKKDVIFSLLEIYTK